MSFSIRTLTSDDLGSILDLQRSLKTYAGVDADIKKGYTTLSYDNYYLNPCEERYQLYGFFNGATLIATIGCIVSAETPSWTLTKFMSLPNDDQAAAKLLSYVIELQEKNHIYQYYTCIAQSDYEAHDRHWNSLVPLRRRYISYLEHIVPPNELTGFENIDHDVLSYTKWPETLVIHTRILPNEYRTNI